MSESKAGLEQTVAHTGPMSSVEAEQFTDDFSLIGLKSKISFWWGDDYESHGKTCHHETFMTHTSGFDFSDYISSNNVNDKQSLEELLKITCDCYTNTRRELPV